MRGHPGLVATSYVVEARGERNGPREDRAAVRTVEEERPRRRQPARAGSPGATPVRVGVDEGVVDVGERTAVEAVGVPERDGGLDVAGAHATTIASKSAVTKSSGPAKRTTPKAPSVRTSALLPRAARPAHNDGATLAHQTLERGEALLELHRLRRGEPDQEVAHLVADGLDEGALTGAEAGTRHAPPHDDRRARVCDDGGLTTEVCMRYIIALALGSLSCDDTATGPSTGCGRAQAAWCSFLIECEFSMSATVSECIANVSVEDRGAFNCSLAQPGDDWDGCVSEIETAPECTDANRSQVAMGTLAACGEYLAPRP